MARYAGPRCKICRRHNQKLFLKGGKCSTAKCALDPTHLPQPRNKRPGQHGESNKSFSEYAIRLDEKQKLKSIYGVLERQFRRYFALAVRNREGLTGENLIKILESRVDNVVYRMGFAPSRSLGRQLVKHHFIEVNGRCVSSPSYNVCAGDIVKIREKGRQKESIKKSLEFAQQRGLPAWVEVAPDKMEGKFLRVPDRVETPIEIKEQYIVEFYSR